jgi:hypothetical protein
MSFGVDSFETSLTASTTVTGFWSSMRVSPPPTRDDIPTILRHTSGTILVMSSHHEHSQSERNPTPNRPDHGMKRKRTEGAIELKCGGSERGHARSRFANTRSRNGRRGKGNGLLVKPLFILSGDDEGELRRFKLGVGTEGSRELWRLTITNLLTLHRHDHNG